MAYKYIESKRKQINMRMANTITTTTTANTITTVTSITTAAIDINNSIK